VPERTTVALQFLLEGARLGEKGLYVTLSETDEELRAGAASHGWALAEPIDVFELVPPEICWMKANSRACCILPILNLAKQPSEFLKPLIECSQNVWCSTVSQR